VCAFCSTKNKEKKMFRFRLYYFHHHQQSKKVSHSSFVVAISSIQQQQQRCHQSDFLSSLLQSTQDQKKIVSNTTTIIEKKLKFDPKSLKLDLFPGLSKREEQQKPKVQTSTTKQEDTKHQQERLTLPKFNFNNNEEIFFSNSPRLQPRKTEMSLSMLSVSRKMGDWEEAMRILASNNNNNTSLSSAEMGMLAQAAWSCSKAVQMAPLENTNSDQQQQQQEEEGGPIEALNRIVLTVIEAFNNSENNNKNHFIQNTIGNLLSLSEALRCCGGVDLVLSLDSVIGVYLREQWAREVLMISTSSNDGQGGKSIRITLFLETQRWNHEVLKAFDVCDDWEGALKFFVEQARRVKTTPKKNVADTQQQQQQRAEPKSEAKKKTVDDQDEPLFQFNVIKKQQQQEQVSDSSSSNSQNNAPSMFGATTVATLIELLNRNGQSKIVTQLLSSSSSSSTNDNKDNDSLLPLIRPAEAAAIGRAYAVLINSYAYGNQSSRRAVTAASSSATSSGTDHKGGLSKIYVSPQQQERINMPKLVLDSKFYRSTK
jgi:hypothetical protein